MKILWFSNAILSIVYQMIIPIIVMGRFGPKNDFRDNFRTDMEKSLKINTLFKKLWIMGKLLIGNVWLQALVCHWGELRITIDVFIHWGHLIQS